MVGINGVEHEVMWTAERSISPAIAVADGSDFGRSHWSLNSGLWGMGCFSYYLRLADTNFIRI